jgi:sulfur transfer ThiS family protein
MKIEVRLCAALQKGRLSTGYDYFIKIDVPPEITVDALLEKIHIQQEVSKVILRNGIKVDREELLQEGDVVSVFG